MPFKIDATSGEIAPGSHRVEIVEAKAGTNAKGNPNIRVVYEDTRGAQLADWLVYLPQVMWRWKTLWTAAGLTWPEHGGEVDENDLVGRRVEIEVIKDTYQGVERPKVREVFAPGPESDVPNDFDTSSGPAAADDDEAPF